MLALVSHLVATFGLPLLPAAANDKHSSAPYPCQSRPCGCLTSERCWAGDCCCFTLEEKITWAETNGVEPPAHVRPLAAARTARPPAPVKTPRQERREPPAAARGRPEPLVVAEAVTGCPHCAVKTAPASYRELPAPAPSSRVRGAVNVFAQRCRGDGPAGLFRLDPAVPPGPTTPVLAGPGRDAHVAPRSEQAASLTHAPPTRPPRPF